ncbi:MAG: hypothetical protein RL419_360, partial [Actinomycetota bacterium]
RKSLRAGAPFVDERARRGDSVVDMGSLTLPVFACGPLGV